MTSRLEGEGDQLCSCRWYVADGVPNIGCSTGSVKSNGLPGQEQRIIAMRGVAWRAKEVEILRIWSDLARAWPTPFESGLTSPAGALTVPARMLP